MANMIKCNIRTTIPQPHTEPFSSRSRSVLASTAATHCKMIYTNVPRGEYGNKRTIFKDIRIPNFLGGGSVYVWGGAHACLFDRG